MAVNLPDDLDLSCMETENGLPMLERRRDCFRCHDTGKVAAEGGFYQCVFCGSPGEQITPFGSLILEFVRKHLGKD